MDNSRLIVLLNGPWLIRHDKPCCAQYTSCLSTASVHGYSTFKLIDINLNNAIQLALYISMFSSVYTFVPCQTLKTSTVE